jgi:polyhydroxyalkanoate synthesis regulator phasin
MSTGKEVLQDLVHNHQDKYDQLMAQEHKDIICEFEECKALKSKSFRVSSKARINDVTQTLTAIKNEVFFSFVGHHQCDLTESLLVQ